jgi:hypothetical protein
VGGAAGGGRAGPRAVPVRVPGRRARRHGVSPADDDTTALHLLLEHRAAHLAAAGIAEPIGAAAFDAGYASEDNFTAPCQAGLYVAVTHDSGQAGQPGAAAPPSGQPGWQAMAAKLDTPEGRAIYRQRKAIIEPVFAQVFTRFGRTLHYRGVMVAAEIHLRALFRESRRGTSLPSRDTC